MKTIKYILAVLMAIAGTGAIMKGTFFGALTLILLGGILLPPVSQKIKQSFKIWENKRIRYASYIALFLISAGFISKSGVSGHSTLKNSNNEAEITYKEYINQVEENVSNLSSERKQQRDNWINELSTNKVYVQLVKNKVVSVDYLPTLTAISDAIKNSVIENGKSQFRISDEIATKIEHSNEGEEKMKFVVNASSLSLKMNGGLPKEIVEVFDRYRTKYGLYNDGQKIFFDNTGKSEKLDDGFNITTAIALFSPNDKKVLDAIYETNFSDIGNWNDDNETTLDYPFMSNKKSYIEHLKKIYDDSKYLPKVDKHTFWEEYSPEVKDRVEMLIFNKDCKKLQEEFETADNNSNSQRARTGHGNTDLMDFLDEQMRELDCFKK